MELLKEFLFEKEIEQLERALPLIAVLIGHCDGTYDEKEQVAAKKIADVHAYSAPELLKPFYKTVANQFENNLGYLTDMVSGAKMMDVELSEELKKVGKALKKLPQKYGYHLYKDFLHYASEIAKSSGGFLRFGSINSDESKWIGLPMIKAIEKPDELLEDLFEEE